MALDAESIRREELYVNCLRLEFLRCPMLERNDWQSLESLLFVVNLWRDRLRCAAISSSMLTRRMYVNCFTQFAVSTTIILSRMLALGGTMKRWQPSTLHTSVELCRDDPHRAQSAVRWNCISSHTWSSMSFKSSKVNPAPHEQPVLANVKMLFSSFLRR